MFKITDLIEACYTNNYVQVVKVLKDIEKTEYLSDDLIDCFIGGMKFLHQDLLIRILHYEERLAIEYFEHYEIFAILYSLELGLNKLSNALLDVLKKYDHIKEKKTIFNLRWPERRYSNLINHFNCNRDNMLMVALYAANGEIVPKMLELKSYGKIFFNHKNNVKHHALNIAINSNQLKAAHTLLEYFNEEDINELDIEGNNTFLYTVINKQYDFMMYLIKYTRCNIKYDAINYITGKNALHFLCEQGESIYASILIDKCPKLVFDCNFFNEFPIMVACKNNLLIVITKIFGLIENHHSRDYMLKCTNGDLKAVNFDFRHIKYVDIKCKEYFGY